MKKKKQEKSVDFVEEGIWRLEDKEKKKTKKSKKEIWRKRKKSEERKNGKNKRTEYGEE